MTNQQRPPDPPTETDPEPAPGDELDGEYGYLEGRPDVGLAWSGWPRGTLRNTGTSIQ